MKVILSHPYCGPLYWWFDQERRYAMPKRPKHPYYAALYGDVDRHLDVALACALIYEDFVIPAADAVHPGMGDLRHVSPADLGLEVSAWDPVEEARRLSAPIQESWPSDPVLCELLAGKSESEIWHELRYAVVDVLLAAEHDAPVLCSEGRRSVARRLVELGVVSARPDVAAALSSPTSAAELVDAYGKVVGLTFGTDDVRRFADLKWTSPLREYADGFQQALERPDVQSTDGLYEAIAKAMESKELAERVEGAFEASGRVTNLLGLFPGVGTVASMAGIGANVGVGAAHRQVDRVRWFELGEAIAGARSRLALEAELRARGLR